MTTAIADKEKSDNGSAIMSPALTREHNQDVVDDNTSGSQSELTNKKATFINSLSRTNLIFSESLEKTSSGNGGHYDGGKHDENSQLNLNNSDSHISANGNSNNNLNDSPSLSSLNAVDMTPRILPSISTTVGVAAGRKSPGIAQTLTAPVRPPTPAKVSSAAITEVPDIAVVREQHESLEHKISSVVKRITHLQGVLMARYGKQQLKDFLSSDLLSSMALNKLADNKKADDKPTALAAFDEKPSDLLTCKLEEPSAGSSTKEGEPLKPKSDLQRRAGIMSANFRQLIAEIDSEATESSSGEETEDLIGSNSSNTSRSKNPANIQKNACWRWARDRAMVISRWTWLQAQVSDLEYKIRQHGELHKQLRTAKKPLLPESGRSQNSAIEDNTQEAARCTQPVGLSSSRHKLLRMSQAPTLGRKARHPPTVRCQCSPSVRKCAMCSGHRHYAKTVDIETLHRHERISHLDSSFHPVLSFPQDVNPAIELEEIVNSNDRKLTATVTFDKQLFKSRKTLLDENLKKQKLARKLKKTKDKQLDKAKKRKLSSGEDSSRYIKQKNHKKKSNKASKRLRTCDPKLDELVEEIVEERHAANSVAQTVPLANEEKRSGHAPAYKRTVSAYDIDDIVIPYQMAATTRVEKLQYKEIDTPRWREKLVNGNSVDEQLHRSSSSSATNSVPMTPITPSQSESPLSPVLAGLSVETTENSTLEPAMLTPDSSAQSLPRSERSSTTSLVEATGEEDISDSKFMARHRIMEIKEQSRYMNFVTTSTRRTRTVSVSTSTASARPGSQLASPVSQTEESVELMAEPSTSASTLSASHDTQQLKSEMSVARKRCSSFTGSRLKKDHSLDTQDTPYVAPWPRRTFPLCGDEVKTLGNIRSTTHRSGNNSSSGRHWKVVPTEEDYSADQKTPLILKLSKT